MKRLFLILFNVLFLISTAWATHNRAGEITYRHISGNTYEFTVYTYTKTTSLADRPWLPIDWGDGAAPDSLERSLIVLYPESQNAQQNTYIKRHTFPGSGEYQICISDPNRNAGILNINDGASVEVEFAISTTLRISPSVRPNNSVFFTNLPLQDACFGEIWQFNPGAVDIDGVDSLSYKLVPSMDHGCVPFELGFFKYPNEIAPAPGGGPVNTSQLLSIDPYTGTITWEVPQKRGQYNLAFIVEEWRYGILISTVLRDMQIDVKLCDNLPPELEAMRDTCVEAGYTLAFNIFADDTPGSRVAITGYGSPFVLGDSQAEIIQVNDLVPTGATFSWLTSCSHVRLAPYQAVIQATDNAETPLVDIEVVNITVIAPAPDNLVADPFGISIDVSWDPSICLNPEGYKLYKKLDPFGFNPSHCETGVPAYTGYVEIADIEGRNNTSFIDNEISFGRENCYMVIAYFEDGAESYASDEVCNQVDFVMPIIKKNSVGVTDVVGVDTVKWRSPANLDLDIFQGPYQYKLFKTEGFGNPDQLLFESGIETDFAELDSSFIDNAPNTQDSPQTYRVDLYNNGAFLVSSSDASSLFLELIPNDNQIEVTWEENHAWVNFEYDIYRQDDGVGAFQLIATIDTLGYIDEGLRNNRLFCYYIVARGSYNSPLENEILVNYSQQACGQAYDRTAPCPPELMGDADCYIFTTDLEWTNPNDVCPETDDVVSYNVYYSPIEGEELTFYQSITGAESTILELLLDNSVAGCYAITALDTLAPWPDGELVQNESEMSNIVCFDNCPNYSLPNIITPNGDGKNDYFSPFPYLSVESVEMSIFNRWGDIVFKTTDPDILWDGTHSESGEMVSSGTYFYACTVYSIRLFGLDPIDLSGYVTVITNGDNNSK